MATKSSTIPQSVTDALQAAESLMAERAKVADVLEAHRAELDTQRERLTAAETELGEAQAAHALSKNAATQKRLDAAWREYRDARDNVDGLRHAIPALENRLFQTEQDAADKGDAIERQLRDAFGELIQPFVQRYRKAAADLERAHAELQTAHRIFGYELPPEVQRLSVADPEDGRRELVSTAQGPGSPEPTKLSDEAAHLADRLSDAAYTIARLRSAVRSAETNVREAA